MFVKKTTLQAANTERDTALELVAKLMGEKNRLTEENQRIAKDHEARATVLADKVRELERANTIIAKLRAELAPFKVKVRGYRGRFVSVKPVA